MFDPSVKQMFCDKPQVEELWFHPTALWQNTKTIEDHSYLHPLLTLKCAVVRAFLCKQELP